ncbi:MAG: hypothetical protein JXA33_17975 [Anaerolineae bacterium]|nr:hypothetical protein [Anaerolineae bacterium]
MNAETEFVSVDEEQVDETSIALETSETLVSPRKEIEAEIETVDSHEAPTVIMELPGEALLEPPPLPDLESEEMMDESQELEEEEKDVVEEPSEPEEEMPLKEAPQPAPKEAKAPRRGMSWWAWLGTVFFSSLLGMIFMVLVFIGINGTLDINRHYAVRALQRQLKTSDSQLATLETEVDGLRNRLDALDALAARIDETEATVNILNETTSALKQEIAALSNELDAVESGLETVQADMVTVQTRSEQVQTFFTRLQDLMAELFGEGSKPSQK